MLFLQLGVGRKRYNFNIDGIHGDITIDSEKMDEIIMSVAGEKNREPIIKLIIIKKEGLT